MTETGKIRGIARDITQYVHLPELCEKYGEGTRVYETHIYLDSHRIHIAGPNSSYELWFAGCCIVPENSPEEDWEELGEFEIALDASTEEVTYTYCHSVRGFTSVLSTPDEAEEDQSYEDWYRETMERELEWCRGNNGPGHITTEYEQWARGQNR